MYKYIAACLLGGLLSVPAYAGHGDIYGRPLAGTTDVAYERQQHYRDARQPVRHGAQPRHDKHRHHSGRHRQESHHHHHQHKPVRRHTEQHRSGYVRVHRHTDTCRH